MKRLTIVALLGTALAITLGVSGINGVFYAPIASTEMIKSPQTGMYILGHVTYVVKDKDGNIKQYAQSDNVVTQAGRNCAAANLFNNMTTGPGVSTAACRAGGAGGSASTASGFNWLAIGNGTTTVSSTGLDQNLTENKLGSSVYGEVQPRIQGTVSYTAATGGSGSGPTITIKNPTASPFKFTEITTSTTINQAGLLDRSNSGQNAQIGSTGSGGGQANTAYAATSGNMFADQNISISVGSSDTLSVTWTITLG